MVWGGALRIAFVYHITWFVNSASHCWGYQSYNTGAELNSSCLLYMLNAQNIGISDCVSGHLNAICFSGRPVLHVAC